MKIEVSKANMNYEFIGDGIPVLLIHGFSLDNNVMKGAYEPLFSKLDGFKRIYVDLPAMGESVETEGLKSSEDILDCLIDFADKVIGNEKFIVIGQSYGGYLAQGIVSSIPEKTLGLGLLCPLVVADSDKRDLPEHKLMIDDRKNINYEDKEEFEEFLDFAVVGNQTTYNRYRADVLIGLNKATSEILEVIREDNYELSPEPYETINCYNKSSLVLVAKQDGTVGYKDVMKLDSKISNLSISMINGAGHALQYEQEITFNDLTLNWLKEFK